MAQMVNVPLLTAAYVMNVSQCLPDVKAGLTSMFGSIRKMNAKKVINTSEQISATEVYQLT
jgi:hypothetical protein